MSEGRKTQVILLDDRRLDLLVQPKLYSTELLDIVASHFNLKEKEYFGLSFKDETGHHHWLHLDRKVLEHEFSKKTGPLVLYFGVRFFIESIGYLRDNATIELFYLQAKQAIYKAFVEVDTESAFELAGHVLQAGFGDYTDDELAKKQLKKLPVLPTSVLREHPNLAYCEEQVLAHYRKLEGHTRGSAIVNYMTIVESLPTYGIHYYEVKDKSGIPWWLGLSHKGISLYDYADKRVPRRVFAWKQLENLYFRDKKFSIEVHDPKRIVHTLSSFNLYEDAIQEPIEEFDDLSDAISDPTTQVSVSRRTFGPGNVNVHAWFASTPQLTKCIWSMAVSQHQFYLDRKQSKSQLPQVRSMSEIATDLCHSSSSLDRSSHNSDGISRSNSAHSLTLSTYNSKTEITVEDLAASQCAQREMLEALEARKRLLEEALKKKTEELKQICLKEGELTGVLPKETPLNPGEPLPQIRRRVGTSFALSPKILARDPTTEANEALARLELDLDLQDKIAKAAYKLAQDKSVAKSVRKQRKQQYHKSYQKLKDLEKKLNDYRAHVGKIPVQVKNSMEESEFISPVNSPAVLNRTDMVTGGHYHRFSGTQGTAPQHKSAPASPVRHARSASSSHVSTPSPNPGRASRGGGGGGYIPNAVYSTRTSYRDQMYPTYSTKDQSGSQSDYENSTHSGPPPPTSNRHVSLIDRENYRNGVQNLYNISTKKTAYYDSADELKSPTSEDYDSYASDVEQDRWRHPDHQPRGYGSLDRNTNAHNIQLTELSPSKFGSKRESHSDYRDSPYQVVDMPPIPRNHPETLHEVHTAPQLLNHDGSEDGHHGDGGSHNTSIPYIDCSQSSISVTSSNSGAPWYGRDHGGTQYESPPPAAFVRQEAPNYDSGYAGYEHPPPPRDSQHPGQHPNQQKMTVTKYQSYVEVSKPFEMSDFYKYSERLRRARANDSPPSSVGSGSTPQSPHHPPQLSHPPPGRHARQQYPSQGQGHPQGQGQGHYPQPSSRSRPSSPYSQQHGYQSANESSTPHYPSHPSPNDSAAYQSSPYPAPPSAAQSNLVHTSYPHVAQHQSTPYQSHSPKHMAYQPPKPMTCQPVRDSPVHGSGNKNVTHRYMDDSENHSFGSFNMSTDGLAQAFSEEMLAWYDDKDSPRHNRTNPYTLV